MQERTKDSIATTIFERTVQLTNRNAPESQSYIAIEVSLCGWQDVKIQELT